jgi:hypothetical protein
MGTVLALIKALPQIISLVSAIVAYAKMRADRSAGYDQAVKDALTIALREVQEANDERNRAQAAHAAQPDSDDAFDRRFERKD